ncbi:MAG: HAD hydrolase family protein [Chitinophagales bacterium]
MWLDKLKEVNTIVLDVDGVLTDGSLICAPDGEIWRNMHAQDGYALQAWLKSGGKMALITSGGRHGVLKKLEQFGVTLVYHDVRKKEEVLTEFVSDYKISLAQTLYMGDDIPDYKAMRLCGVRCCPANAAHEIKSIVDYISPLNGGKGCVRDVIEKTLRVQDKWFKPPEDLSI